MSNASHGHPSPQQQMAGSVELGELALPAGAQKTSRVDRQVAFRTTAEVERQPRPLSYPQQRDNLSEFIFDQGLNPVFDPRKGLSNIDIEEKRSVKSALTPHGGATDEPGAAHIQTLHSDLQRMMKGWCESEQDLRDVTVLGMRYGTYNVIKSKLGGFPGGEDPFGNLEEYAIQTRNGNSNHNAVGPSLGTCPTFLSKVQMDQLIQHHRYWGCTENGSPMPNQPSSDRPMACNLGSFAHDPIMMGQGASVRPPVRVETLDSETDVDARPRASGGWQNQTRPSTAYQNGNSKSMKKLLNGGRQTGQTSNGGVDAKGRAHSKGKAHSKSGANKRRGGCIIM
ncbi:uncharacterized protein BKCO1_4800032 [Diplodia corticola]|uniref:Uncharacterized protein n=1 Tax=Diplodia corticola TaxID=236234 RepID=A0A1J9QR44_9PEZI|nr:uncharacterized protein BKCO1_4800032 [Diplodia corticola]OJD31414.1 hypothetical protein BKCO1_4800032 [Diplodia corticola]